MTDGWMHPDDLDPAAGNVAFALPEPTRGRWQPLRAGLIDLFFYDREEFWFRDGHLLLRGNNGTGKSKVLALLLPFLLDGEVTPHRVEPDGDPSKRMEWNLLLGGRYDERVGYTWLELGRVDEDGQAQYLTLGCGLKAVTGRGAPARWFFLTDRRVGVDLWLVNPTGTAKTKDRLAEALADRGQVLEGPATWRRIIDERLFHLGAERYEALLSLLIQLRQPQLSKRPNEQALSDALTGALAPPDQAIVAEVADAFRSLEAQRADLDALAEAQSAVATFDARYRRYAAVATRRRAADVRRAQSSYEAVNRRLTTAMKTFDDESEAEAAAKVQVAEADSELAGHRAAERALRDSPAMQAAATLDEVRKAAESAEGAAKDAEQRLADTRAARDRAVEALAAAEGVAAASRAQLEGALEAAELAATAAQLDTAHAAALRVLDSGGLANARRAAAEATDRRERDARHVLGLVAAFEKTAVEVARRRELRDNAATARDTASERHAEQEAAVTATGRDYAVAVERWARACAELPVDAEAVAGHVGTWTASLDGANPATVAADAAARGALEALAAAAARLDRQRQDAEEEQAGLATERERLAAGGIAAPPAPHTRAGAGRDDLPGAPLWQVVDFHDGVPGDQRAGLEAALEAGGLLDARVTPDGQLLDRDTLDAILVPAAGVADNLTSVLRPSVDRDDTRAAVLSDEAVLAVLRGIGLGPAAGATSWVDTDGGWRLGVAHGRWRKPAARYVGHAAREGARRDRITELDGLLRDLGERLRSIAAAIEQVERRRQTVTDERAALPDDATLRDAVSRLGVQGEELRRLEADVRRLDGDLAPAVSANDSAEVELAEAAADLHVPRERDALEALLTAVVYYRLQLADLWPAIERHAEHVTQTEDRREEVERRVRAVEATEREVSSKAQLAAGARRRHTELHAAVGADVAALEERLASVLRLQAEAETRRDAAEQQRQRHHDAATRAEHEVKLLDEQLEDSTARRRDATAAFQRFARHGLLAAAAPAVGNPDVDSTWAPDTTVRLARRIDQALSDVDADDAVWDRVQHQITEHFATLTESLSRHGHNAAADLTDDGLVVTISYEARATTPAALAAQLAEDLADRERLLSARERELLENHLVADVATHLPELITRAEQQVSDVNRELSERPTSTGMRLRLVWKPRADAPANLDRARQRLLRQTADAWSPQDREAVGQFLQDRIADVRAASEGGTWLDHLTEALDYRTWHAFAVERRQDGAWRPASGPASGGERALAVTLPLFAAASSYYATAGNPNAPRLVLLDEAFAGVDDDSRGKCMGLLAEFDLDFVMTSEREWGCYASLPGLGIAQLARRDGIDAVHVTRWEWDGRARSHVDPALPPLREPVASPGASA